MAEFIRLTAVEADTELREMRAALLQKLTQLDKKSVESTKTRTRIAAFNRALQSLASEKPVQGVLLTTPPTAAERPRID